MFALKKSRTEFEVAVRHFNSDRFAIAEKILSKRTIDEWGDLFSAVLLLKIKCSFAQGHYEKTRVFIHEFHHLYPESSYKSDVFQLTGDLLINEGFYSSAFEFYLKARIGCTETSQMKIDKRILNTISIGLPIQDIEAIQFLEVHRENQTILMLSSAITHIINGEKEKGLYLIQLIDPLNLPETFFNLYDDLLKMNTSENNSRVNVGVILPLTGENNYSGQEFLNGLESGFLNQKHLDYSVYVFDNESSLTGTIQNLKALSEMSQVSSIIGFLPPNHALAGLTSIYAKNKQFFLPFEPTETLENFSTQATFLNPSINQKGRWAARYMTEHLNLDTIAVIAPASEEGKQYVDAFLAELDKQSIVPIFLDWYHHDSKNLKKQFTALRKTAWDLLPAPVDDDPFLGMDIDSLNAMFSIDVDDFFEEEEIMDENPLKTKRDSSKVKLETIEGLYLPLAHQNLSFIGTQYPMYNLQTQIVGHDGWLDLETLNKENIGPHFQNLILLTSTQYKYLTGANVEEYNRGMTEFVDGYDTAIYLSKINMDEHQGDSKLIDAHSHLYFFPDHSQVNKALHLLTYQNNQFTSSGYFLADTLISIQTHTP